MAVKGEYHRYRTGFGGGGHMEQSHAFNPVHQPLPLDQVSGVTWDKEQERQGGEQKSSEV